MTICIYPVSNRRLNLSNRQRYNRPLSRTVVPLIAVSTDEIRYISAASGLAKLHLSEKRIFTIDLSLDEIEQQLDPDLFLRVTRYHVVNVHAVERLTTWFGRKTKVQVADWPDAEIYVIKEKAPALKRWLDR